MKINTKLGVFHLHNKESDNQIWQVCDSDDKFITNLYGETSLKSFLDDATNITHITDLCVNGLIDNISFGNTKVEAIVEVLEYVRKEKYHWENERWNYNDEDIQALEEYVNRVGDTYFIVDYTEL